MSSFSNGDTEPRWLNAQQEAAWRGYRWMRALLDLQVSRDLATDSHLSDADYDVLSNLSEVDTREWRLKELADRLLWSESRLSHQVSRMQDRGLVVRRRTEDDRRGTVVALTDEGWDVLVEAAPHHVESVRRHFIDLLTDEEVRTLRIISDRVVGHLTTVEP